MVKISIIIPTYNRPARLASCLESLVQQSYPRENFEVIVVDDGGSVDLEPDIESVDTSLNIKLVRQKNTGPAGARNTGVANATGEFIAFLDDDCALSENWLPIITQYLQNDGSRMYGGLTINALEKNLYSSASQAMIDFLYGYYNTVPEKARFLASNNMAMSRTLFDAAGGFDTSFPGACGEDRELCDRWLQLGHPISFVSEALIFHYHHLGLRSFWKQHFNYGTGAKRFWESKARRNQGARKTEPPAFYRGLITYAWTEKLNCPLPLSLLMVLSQFANVAGFIREKFRAG
jgi:GT2 family glycosyltransferase